MRGCILFLDGIVGAGKTTLLEKYRNMGITVLCEPVEEWVNSGMLAKFYNDYNYYEWQKYVLTTFIKHIENNLSNGFMIVERGHVSAFKVFTYMNRHKMQIHEYYEIMDIYEKFDKQLRMNGYMYDHVMLDTDVDTCIERISIRNRENENTIDKSYLLSLYSRMTDLGITKYSENELDEYIKLFLDFPFMK
jgi:deoxyadenosine/deoxycytidine kinase